MQTSIKPQAQLPAITRTLCIVACGTAIAIQTGCGSSDSSSSSGTTTPTTPTISTRTLDAFETFSKTVTTTFDTAPRTCSLVDRDTSSCQSARQALGLSGNWLAFSCNVTEGLADSSQNPVTNIGSATYVTLTTQGMPDYKSNFYPTTGTYSFTANDYTVTGNYADLHESFTPDFPNPNMIAASTTTIYIPLTPAAAGGTTQEMSLGATGMAMNGVLIFDGLANSTDNIFAESGGFDQCGGHPTGTNKYHYHAEPYSISYQDNRLIGVMRDGYFIYGRNDYDASTPGSTASVAIAGNTSDMYVYGGHAAADPLTGTGSTFHYHLSEWKGCYDENAMTKVKQPDDGMTEDSFQTTPSTGTCSGIWVDAWFISGHGNGGVFYTTPAGLTGQSPSQNTPAKRYYYGTPGPCSGC